MEKLVTLLTAWTTTVKYSLFLISSFFCSITNFLFHRRLDLLATQTKMDEVIINLLPPVFTFISSLFSSLAKDAQSDSTFVTSPFFLSRDAQLDKFATQIMRNKAIVSLSLSVSFSFRHFSILRDKWLNWFANQNMYRWNNYSLLLLLSETHNYLSLPLFYQFPILRDAWLSVSPSILSSFYYVFPEMHDWINLLPNQMSPLFNYLFFILSPKMHDWAMFTSIWPVKSSYTSFISFTFDVKWI